MSDMQVRILGCGSARPTRHHLPAAQILSVSGHCYLIDAGEGVQHSLLASGCKLSQIEALFLSHVHGDHCFGLPGLLTSMVHLGRTKPLVIVTTPGVADFVRYITEHFVEDAPFALSVRTAPEQQVGQGIYQDRWIRADALPLRHRIPAVGFLFTEQVAPRRINPAAVRFYQIPYAWMEPLQLGLDYAPAGGGAIIPNRTLTLPGRRARRYAYLSDTLPAMHLVEEIRGADLLYHEATYHEEYRERAAEYGHSTAEQAARVALAAGVQRLLIGHYSGRYDDVSPLLEEARRQFPNTFAVNEGELYKL